jgi:hypothetical protein
MTIPILGWHGLGEGYTSVERYREMAAGGFTHNLAGWSDTAGALAALDAAHQAGMKQFIHTGALIDKPQAIVPHIRNHPALAGYNVTDEPSADAFEKWGQVVRRIARLDPRHPCYINLFPTYATPGSQLGTATYQEYLDQFLQTAGVDLLTFDHYPVMEKSLRKDYFENLELVSATARREHLPFWAFALCTAHKPYPVPTLGHLRLQQYSNLAYGAQGLQYFTYTTPTPGTWDFHEGPLETDGRRTPVWDLVARFNAELHGRAWVFDGAAVESVGHTGAQIPKGTRPYAMAEPIRHVELGGVGALVSLLRRGRRRSLVVVNRDHTQPAELAVEWDAATPMHLVDRFGGVCEASGGGHKQTLEPGMACILCWRQ